MRKSKANASTPRPHRPQAHEVPWQCTRRRAGVLWEALHTPRCGAEDAAEGVRPAGQRVAREASDRTHLAGKLRATHPGEAHDGGSRGVESGVQVVRVTFGGFRCCKSMMGSCDRP
jgi:hypothetical protein